MMRGKWLLFSGAAVLVAIAAGALSLLRRSSTPAPSVVAPAPSPPPFTGSEISLSGKIRAQKVVPVAVQIEGTIESLNVAVGEEVYEGQLLGQIKNTGLETTQQVAALDAERAQTRLNTLEGNFIAARLEASRAHAEASRSQSDFDRAEKVYARQQMLFSEGATPRLVFEKAQKEFELARTEFRALEQVGRGADERVTSLQKDIDNARRAFAEKNEALEAAQQDLAACEIHSPVDGIVVARSKQPGDEVNRDLKDLFQIAVELSSLEVVLEPEPPVLERIRPGQEAVIQLAEIPTEGLPGKVREIHNGQVAVEFVSPSTAIRPGLTAQVRIKLI
jgi:multidrug resistance efflux pump